MSESSSGTDPTGNSSWWESTPTGTPVPLAFVKLDRAGLTREWQELSEEDELRRRAQYITGVEYVADKLGAAQPLQWQGDGVMLFFKGDEQKSAVTRAFEAAEAIRERVIVDLAMQVRIAVHAAVVAWNPEAGKLEHPAIDQCKHLEHAAPVNGIVVTEDVFLALPEPQQQRFTPLGMTARDGVAAYVFPASLVVRKDPEAFRPGEDLWLRDNFRRYVGSPEIRRLRYVGFPLQKKQPPSLDIREVFIAPEARGRARQGPDWSQAAQVLRAGIGLSGELLEARAQLRQVETHLPPEPIAKLVTRHRSLVVLGDPGSGKTTVLRWLAVVAAGGPLAWAEQFGTTERLLPLMVSVGWLAEIRSRLGEVCSVIDALAVYFHDRNVGGEGELKGVLERALEAGECLILLDGLDEVRSELRGNILRWLETFCARFPRNRFVVSARRVGYSGFSLPAGVEVELGPLSDEQIRRYARAFERACRRWENNGVPDDVGADRDSKKLLDALFENPRLRDLARNPFLLSALVLIHRAEGRLPRHRVQAYEVFARTLCETWSQARRVVAGEVTTRDIRYEEEAIPILGELALRMHEEWPTGVAPEDFIIRTLAMAIQRRNEVAPREAERAAKEFLERAGREVQILLERGTGQWGFLHLTFQELFTAVGLLSSERFESVAFQHLFDPRWEEILRLGIGYMALIQKRAQATQRFIRDVLTHEARGSQRFLTKLLRKQVYLAALLASEAGDVLPLPLQEEVARAVVEWSKSMPDSVVEPFLRELALTEFADRLLDVFFLELRSKNEQVRAGAVFALGLMGGERAQQALLGAVGDSSSMVRSSACIALPDLKTPLSWEALATLARDQEYSVHGAALSEILIKGGESRASELAVSIAKDSRPEILTSFLTILAGRSMFEWTTGKKFLARIHPEALSQVLRKGLQSKREQARQAAQIIIHLEWNSLPEGFKAQSKPVSEKDRQLSELVSGSPYILPEAFESRDENIRFLALNKIVHNGDKPGISALIELARHDSADIREDVMNVMGRIQDERITAVLLNAARDPKSRVRAAAISSLGELHAPEAEELMIRSLRDRNRRIRMSAIQGLGTLESPAAIRPLVQIAQKTSNLDERHEALEALWKLSARVMADNKKSTAAREMSGKKTAPRRNATGRKRTSSKKPGTRERTSVRSGKRRKNS